MTDQIKNVEIFKSRTPMSNFCFPNGRGIIFTPNAVAKHIGEYATSDPMEIAELKAACLTSSGMIYQREDEAKSPEQIKLKDEIDPDLHNKQVQMSEEEINARRKSSQAALTALNQQGGGAQASNMGAVQGQNVIKPSNTGIVNSSTIAGTTKDSNSK